MTLIFVCPHLIGCYHEYNRLFWGIPYVNLWLFWVLASIRYARGYLKFVQIGVFLRVFWAEKGDFPFDKLRTGGYFWFLARYLQLSYFALWIVCSFGQ